MKSKHTRRTWIVVLCFVILGGSWLYAGPTGKERIIYNAIMNAGSSNDIFTSDPDDSDVRNLTPDLAGDMWWTRLSPDGTKILFMSNAAGATDLWWMYSDGTCPTQITTGIGVNWPQWYDDDTVLYVHTYGNGTGDICSIDIDGSNDALLIDQPDPSNPQITNFAYSWVSHKLVFAAQVGSWVPTHDLYLTEVFSSSTHGPVSDFYADQGDDHDDRSPVFSPDGLTVYWTHCMGPGPFPNNPAIVEKSISSAKPVYEYDELVRSATGNRVSVYACSPDGNYLLYTEPDCLFIMDLVQLEETALQTASIMGGGDWGYLNVERVLYTTEIYENATVDIISIHPDGTQPVNLTAEFDGDAWWPRVSPDGTKILFLGRTMGEDALWYMNSDGSNKTQITSGIGVIYPQWYDDDTVLYTHTYGNGTGDIRSIDIDGSNDALLIDKPDPSNPQITNFAYSWVSHRLVFAAQVGSWVPTHDLYITEVYSSSTHGPVSDFYADPGDDHDDRSIVFSPDGLIVYWTHCINPGPFPNGPAIVKKAIDSPLSIDEYDELIRNASGNRMTVAACSPDETHLLFSEYLSSDPDCMYTWDLALSSETLLHSEFRLSGSDWGRFYQVPDKLMARPLSMVKGASDPISFTLNAGPENAGRVYLLLAGASGTVPGTALPGGQATLPINWDIATDIVLRLLNEPPCANFYGTLNQDGVAEATFNAYGALNDYLTLHFAYALNNPFDFASNPVCVHVID